MIEYPTPHVRLSFACPPGVGARWVVRACQLAGLGWQTPAKAYMPFTERNGTRRFRFTLVRHPCDWLWNCYCLLKMADTPKEFMGEITSVPCFSALEQGCFEGFVRCYLHTAPGGLTEVHRRYEADTVCRYEDMPWALLELLLSLGVPRDLSRGCTRQKLHVEAVRRLDVKARAAVMRAECELSERYDYW